MIVEAEEPAKYKNLLETIAKGESKGNYNAYYGKVNNTKIRFTSMTINEVLRWQYKFVSNGSPSSAVGKYQIIRPTLLSLVEELNLDTKQPFDESTQDKLAVVLMKRRGLDEYKAGKIDQDEFANNLSKEWAALPATAGKNRNKSYYHGDGLNKSRISITEVRKGIKSVPKTLAPDNERKNS